jgi:hypothetical protein
VHTPRFFVTRAAIQLRMSSHAVMPTVGPDGTHRQHGEEALGRVPEGTPRLQETTVREERVSRQVRAHPRARDSHPRSLSPLLHPQPDPASRVARERQGRPAAPGERVRSTGARVVRAPRRGFPSPGRDVRVRVLTRRRDAGGRRGG